MRPFPERFSIFKNDRKQKETDPDYYILSFKENAPGSDRVGACWLKDGKAGKFLSCSQKREMPPVAANPEDVQEPQWP